MFGEGVSPPAQVVIAIVFAGVFGLLAQNQTLFFMILACFAPFILHDFIVENKETNKENSELRKRVYALEDRTDNNNKKTYRAKYKKKKKRKKKKRRKEKK